MPEQQVKDLGLEDKVNWRGMELFGKNVDKGRKILSGITYAEQFSPSHVMIVDADDCINKNIAEFVSQNSDCPGWYMNKGYVYYEYSRFLRVQFRKFSQACGSAVIVKFELVPLMFEDYYLYIHSRTVVGEGITLKPLPFAGAIYSVGNQENIFQTIERQNQRYRLLKKIAILVIIKNIFWYRFITKSIRNDFGFYPIDEVSDKSA